MQTPDRVIEVRLDPVMQALVLAAEQIAERIPTPRPSR